MAALVQQSEEWLKVRKNKIGASDASIIMEASPWKTPYQLWLEKVSSDHLYKKSESMQRGLDLENEARVKFEEMTGLFVLPEVRFHKEHEWMMASLDGIDIEQKNVVEIKCPSKIDHNIALNGEIPTKYFPQLQHQIEVCEIDMAYYFSYDGENGTIVKVYRDDKYIKQMLTKEEEFYECMQNFIAPSTNEKDYQLTNDDMTSFLALKLINLKENIKDLEKQEKEIMNDLLMMCGQKNTKGKNFKLTKTVRKGSVDYNKIPELEGVRLEDYRKDPTYSWRIANG